LDSSQFFTDCCFKTHLISNNDLYKGRDYSPMRVSWMISVHRWKGGR